MNKNRKTFVMPLFFLDKWWLYVEITIQIQTINPIDAKVFSASEPPVTNQRDKNAPRLMP
jgi:hypothetical protein